MPLVFFSRRVRGTAKGSALVIVLFFVILLSVVTIAFLSRSMTAVKVSASSAGETKSRILASSASDIIIGDFKQEIIAGSNANANTVNYPVYVPSSNQNMIPFQNGIPTSGTAIPNLISRSVNPANTTGAGPYVAYPSRYTAASVPPNRAANDPNSTPLVNSTLPSVNGRYISAAQWNSHYLIPRNPSVDSPGSTSLDSTPVTSFVAPDWVVVTRAGANSVTWSSGTGGLNDPTLTNTNFAVGRYAFAVYNEGGLLDMNVAGYPADPSNPGGAGSNGLTAAQISEKGSLALADLTQLPASSSSSTTMTQAQVNSFVGWRNYASAGASGSFPNFTFTPSAAGNWLTNFVYFNSTNGFMQILPSGVASGNTDQALLSRQQLISVINSIGISPDFLQYMGSFSRGLEQPSYVANSNLPKIVGTSTPPSPAAPAVNSYQGNNTYYGGETTINLRGGAGLLGVRVGSTFTRLDGTAAVAGEPLIKRKFALSRLALVTTGYAPTFASTTAAASDPVYQRFGLYRTSTSSPWIYDHGIAAGGAASSSSAPAIIATLAYVAAAKREPDFAELLKAAINAGSVGKAGPSGTALNDQYQADTSGDVQILQLVADLIDQQKTDNYPTWIQYTQVTSGGQRRAQHLWRPGPALLLSLELLQPHHAGAIADPVQRRHGNGLGGECAEPHPIERRDDPCARFLFPDDHPASLESPRCQHAASQWRRPHQVQDRRDDQSSAGGLFHDGMEVQCGARRGRSGAACGRPL